VKTVSLVFLERIKMPQASQPLLFEVPQSGSPPEQSEGGKPAPSFKISLSGSPFEQSENGNPATLQPALTP
jgi:hypothetical protein